MAASIRICSMTPPGGKPMIFGPIRSLPCSSTSELQLTGQDGRSDRSPFPLPIVAGSRWHFLTTEPLVSKHQTPSPQGGLHGLPTGYEGHHDIGGVPIEVLPPAVIHRGGPGIGMPSGKLDVTERYSSIEGGHDERRSEHV